MSIVPSPHRRFVVRRFSGSNNKPGMSLQPRLPHPSVMVAVAILVAWVALSPAAFSQAQQAPGGSPVRAQSYAVLAPAAQGTSQATRVVPTPQESAQPTVPLRETPPTQVTQPTRQPTQQVTQQPTQRPTQQPTQRPAQPTQQPQGQTFAHDAFRALWERTDGPVAAGITLRPWIWGPAPGRTLTEPFAGLPGDSHLVQYFDKGRMEINDPNGDPDDPFFVTNGLLAVELISGQMQTGPATYENRGPATINIGSDADDRTAPTYQSFNGVSNIPGAPNERRATSQVGQPVRTAIDRQGRTQPWPATHPDYGVRIVQFEPTTGHNIPDVFWTFLNAEAETFVDGDLVPARLFNPWFSVTGFPISEPYWSYVKVEGEYMDVMTQAYERRVLTFLPHLPTPFKVQMGNIGQHYYEWRYLRGTNTGTPGPVDTAATPTARAGQRLPNVTIDEIKPRSSLIDLNSNYCVITNREESPVNLTGWWVDSPKYAVVDRYYFPAGFTLQPGASVRVHAGRGNDTATDLYMFRTTTMWDGRAYDLAVLYDSQGREVNRLFPAAEGGPPEAPPVPTNTPPRTAGVAATATRAVPTTATGATATVPRPVGSAQASATTGVTGTPTNTATAGSVTATRTASGSATVTSTPTRTPTP